jgi:hypothetical protein
MLRSVLSTIWEATAMTILALLMLSVAGAQVMSSPSYQLTSDSVNVGGGLSSSTNYVQESTVGEIATGPSDSTSYNLRAGYQQMQSVFLSLSAPADVTMSPDLGGISGGTSNGSTTVTVITDSPSGYQITIQVSDNPALQLEGGSDTIANYVGAPDYTFAVGTGEAVFGFTATGVDIESEFAEGAGSTCGGGVSNETLVCWDGLSTSARTIVSGSGGNQPSGATTTIHFRVGIDSDAVVAAGLYTATSTLTAYPL